MMMLLKDEDFLKEVGVHYTIIQLIPTQNVAFQDLKEKHWAYAAVKDLAQKGIIQGISEAKFAPNQSLKVNDACTLLDRILLANHKVATKLSREVVAKYIKEEKNWAYAHKMSIGSKLSEETLKSIANLGDQPITRQLLAQVLYELTEENQMEAINSFEDMNDSPYQEALTYCYHKELLKGVKEGQMAPERPVTRAEMAVILMRLEILLSNK